MASIWTYQFSNATTAPPTGNQLRLDTGPPYETVARLWVRYQTTDGIDVYYSLAGIPPGTLIYLQDKDDHTRIVQLRTTAAPIDVPAGGYVEIPVTWIGSGAALINQIVGLVLAPAPVTLTPPGPGAALVSLADAKLFLHVTDPARDLEVAMLLGQASGAIVDYLGAQADPIWDETTAPEIVQAAVLKMLAYLWEHRGDDSGPDDHDAKLWHAIALLLMRTRDPAIA